MKIYNPIKKFTGMLIRFDDITDQMNWDLMNKCEDLFLKYNIQPLMGVIPNNQDEEFKKYEKKNNFWEIVRSWQKKGWEISMHGFNHVYDSETDKKDFFGYGGKSEFFGHSLETQSNKIKNGLSIFKNEGVNVRSFFAPNHTYDLNTFEAIKQNGIKNIIDGYGLIPYQEFGLNFIPQLFYKEIMLPIGIQSTQIHLNYMNEKKFEKLEKFIEKNYKNIINFNEVLKKIRNNFFSSFSRITLEKSLKTYRLF